MIRPKALVDVQRDVQRIGSMVLHEGLGPA
jgi:hypothetical protein